MNIPIDNAQSLRDMVKSCFTYGGADRNSYNFERYILPYKDRFDSEDEFNKIYDEQLKDLKENFEIKHDVHTDFEGCTYNSLVKKI